MARSRIVFSASEAYFPAAAREVSSAYRGARIGRLGPDVGCLDAVNVHLADVAETCLRRPVVFVRHLMAGETALPTTGAATDVDRVRAAASQLLSAVKPGAGLALQVWTSGVSPCDYRADELWRRLADDLRQQGFEPTRGGQDETLSVCVTPNGILLGRNRRANTLADWPGGRVSLAKDAAQVSRSEFKLEELFKVCELPLPSGGTAIDLGASPGGWTRVARRCGLTVWAIDPGDLDPRVAADPGVHHAKTTAGRFLAETELTFDLVLNDMRMVAGLSCRVMLDAARRLTPGGLAIMTLKLSPRDPLTTVNQAFSTLRRAYDVTFARQLYHNRNEVTIVARRHTPSC